MPIASLLNKVNFGTPVWKVKLNVLVRRKHFNLKEAFDFVDAIRAARAMESFEWYYTREEFLACGDVEDQTLKTINIELVVDENLEWLLSHKDKLAWECYGFVAKLHRDVMGIYHFLPFGKK